MSAFCYYYISDIEKCKINIEKCKTNCFYFHKSFTMLTCRLLVKDFSKYLPVVDDCGDFILDENGDKIMPGSEAEARLMGVAEKTEDEVLEEMKLLDM